MNLVGRDSEIEVLRRALEGERRLLVLRGEAGIGKTRLLGVLREEAAARRITVLSGRASEFEQDVPLAPFAEALEPHLRRVPARVLGRLDADHRARLAAVFEGFGTAAPVATAGERWRLHRAVSALLELLAGETRLALVLDDVHWADPASLELLDHLLRRPPNGRLLLALGLRPGPAAARIAAAQRAGGAGGGAVTLDLRPLDRKAGVVLLGDTLDPDERERRFRDSGGNPLLLEELARMGAGKLLPEGLVAAVGAEITGLPAAAAALLAGAAIAGDPFDLDLAGAVAGLGAHETLTALDSLIAHVLVRATEHPRRFAFRHPVVRTAAYARIPPGARLAGHDKAAAALTSAPLSAQAHHLAHSARPGDRAAAAILRQAATAVRPQAPAIAADWLLAAHRAAPGERSLLARVLVEAGRLPEALAIVDESGAGCPAEAELAVTGAAVERMLGRHDAARRRLERALQRSPGSAPLMAECAAAAYMRADVPETLRWAEAALAASGAGLVRGVAGALAAAANAFTGGGDEALLDAALADVHGAGDQELAEHTGLALAVPWVLLSLERIPEALAIAQRHGAVARRTGQAAAAAVLDLAVVMAFDLLGRTAEAAAAAERAEQAARVTGVAQVQQWALWMLAWLLLQRGELDRARSLAEESVALAEQLDDSVLGAVARMTLGAVLVSSGDHEPGRALLAGSLPEMLEPGWICRWTAFLVCAEIAVGEHESAARHAEAAAALAARLDLAGSRSAASRAQALVALAEGDSAGAVTLARAAIADAERAELAGEAAHARLLLARALEDRDQAIAELLAVGRFATEAGATRMRDEAVRELRRRGRRVGRGGARAAGAEGLTALSARERDIAELVARGNTNKQIAARLYLSEKTIETHLSRVFGKLGVRSRAEVAARVAARAS